MTATTPGPHPLTPADRGALWFLLVLGAAFALVTLLVSVMRIFEILLGESATVTADLSPAGSDTLTGGASNPAFMIDAATFTVTHFEGAAFFAAISQPVLVIIVTIGIAISFAVLARNLLRGDVFRRSNTAAVVTAWAFGLAHTIVQPVLQFATAHGALEQLGYEPTPMLALRFSPALFIAVILMVALTAHAFSVGTKLQRETEGLI